MKHGFDLAQAVAEQGGTAAHDVANGLGQANAGRNFDRARNGVQLGLHALASKVVAEQLGVRGGNTLALQVGHRIVLRAAGHSQAQAALAEAQRFDFESGATSFDQHVLAHDT